MHPDNLYSSKEPDFAALAALHPPLQQYVQLGPRGRAMLDFTSWSATRELTAALLAVDFGITWTLPQVATRWRPQQKQQQQQCRTGTDQGS
jgi:23S rRNA (adenine1618-N6)-methyltransferase